MTKLDKHKQVVINLFAAITAFIVFELGNVTINETRNNALINDLFDKLEKQVKQKILECEIKIPPEFELKVLFNPRIKNRKSKMKNQKLARNIYYNLCQNENLYQKFKNTFSCLNNQLQFIDLKHMLGLKTFECSYKDCIRCNCSLRRYTKNKGNICIAYANLDGPQVGISYMKKCENCKIKYYYGRIEFQNLKQRISLKELEYFELSNYTYIKKDLLRSTEFHLFELAKGFEKKVNAYNFDHQHNIKQTAAKLKFNQETLGKRQSHDAALESNRLIEAFYLFTLQNELETECNVTLCISKIDEERLIKQKQERIQLHRKSSSVLSSQSSQNSGLSQASQNKTIGDQEIGHLASKDYFDYWYVKHKQDIESIDSGIMNLVPVKAETGEPCIGHFMTMMYGNAKNIRYVCSYFEDDAFKGMI